MARDGEETASESEGWPAGENAQMRESVGDRWQNQIVSLFLETSVETKTDL